MLQMVLELSLFSTCEYMVPATTKEEREISNNNRKAEKVARGLPDSRKKCEVEFGAVRYEFGVAREIHYSLSHEMTGLKHEMSKFREILQQMVNGGNQEAPQLSLEQRSNPILEISDFSQDPVIRVQEPLLHSLEQLEMRIPQETHVRLQVQEPPIRVSERHPRHQEGPIH